MRRAIVLPAIVLGLAALGAAASAQDNVKPLAGFEDYPGYLFYYMERPTPHRIEMRAIPEGIVKARGLMLEFPAAEGKPGLIFRELNRKDGTDFSAFAGFSVWVRGDGSDATGAVVLGYSSGPTAAFPLKNAKWHRVDLRWSDFTPAAEAKKIEILAFTLSADSKRPARYAISRPAFLKDFAKEDPAGLRPEAMPLEMLERGPDFSKYAARGEKLVKVKAKLRAKEPLTIVAMGDSITAGSQLWPVGDKAAQAAAIYHALFAEMLKKKYGYADIKVVNTATGGKQTHQALPNIGKEALDHKPDLVIMALGAADSIYSNLARFKDSWTKIIERLRAEGIEVICWAPTPVEYQVKKGDAFADYVRTYAKEHDLPLADPRACFMVREESALGELIPDDAHPNPRGHELMAEVLFALFKD